MRMTVTMDNVTTDKALRLLSALEFGHLLEETKIEMDQKDAVEVAEEYLKSLLPQKSSQFETTPALPQDAGDCDLFIDDVAGFHLQDALDAWIQGRDRVPYKLTTALPRIGSPMVNNRVTIDQAQKLLGWSRSTIYNFIYTGTVDFYYSRGARRYELTREQVAVLALARKMQEATGQKRLGRRIIRQATRAFLTAFPRYIRLPASRVVAA